MAVYPAKKPTKDGRKYYFRIKYKDAFGKIHDYKSEKYKNERDAKLEEAYRRIKIANNEISITQITLKQAMLEYVTDRKSKVKNQTFHKYQYLIGHLECLSKYKINEIDLNKYKKLQLYIESLNFTTGYKNKIIGFFKSVLLFSAKYYNTSTNLCKFIEPYKEVNVIKKEMNFFTLEEYKAFTSVIESLEDRIFFDILYYMGLRCGECQALTWNDINFFRNEIRINKTLTTKIKGEIYTISSPKTKNSIRTLPIPKSVLNGLKNMYNNAISYKDYSKEWFVFGNSLPFRESTIQTHKNNYCKLAGVQQIRIHDFRHSCASLLINQGASIALVSKYLGHSNISITLDIYTHMFKNELENITEKLNNL